VLPSLGAASGYHVRLSAKGWTGYRLRLALMSGKGRFCRANLCCKCEDLDLSRSQYGLIPAISCKEHPGGAHEGCIRCVCPDVCVILATAGNSHRQSVFLQCHVRWVSCKLQLRDHSYVVLLRCIEAERF